MLNAPFLSPPPSPSGPSEHIQEKCTGRALLRLFTSLALLSVLCCSLLSCGGGGGDDFFGPAEVDFDVTPKSVFIGDRVLVKAELREVNEDGIVLIYRFPTALSYVNDSAMLRLDDDDETSLTPVLNQAVEDDEEVYLVFVLPFSAFDQDAEGTVELQLIAIASKDNALIELDPNIRDLEKSNTQQFDISNPVFGTDINERIEIRK